MNKDRYLNPMQAAKRLGLNPYRFYNRKKWGHCYTEDGLIDLEKAKAQLKIDEENEKLRCEFQYIVQDLVDMGFYKTSLARRIGVKDTAMTNGKVHPDKIRKLKEFRDAIRGALTSGEK